MAAQRLAFECQAVGAVEDSIQDGVSDRDVVDPGVPVLRGELRGDDGAALLGAVIDELQQVWIALVNLESKFPRTIEVDSIQECLEAELTPNKSHDLSVFTVVNYSWPPIQSAIVSAP